MRSAPNALVWNGQPGHYEVYYLTLTDPATGVGCWIRYTLLAPLDAAAPPTAALWFLAMDPRPGRPGRFARKVTVPATELDARADPFELRIGSAVLTERGMSGAADDAAWDLRYERSNVSLDHIHPVLRATRAAQTMLTLPQADLRIDGTITFAGERLELQGARGGQAHLWGTKHARNWAWVHCNDFVSDRGEPVDGAVLDAVSVIVTRYGREIGPSTPVVGRFDGEDFLSTSPLRVLSNPSTYALSGWRFEAVAGARRLIGEVDADRALLAGVTYHDPDGETAYCYNSEAATLRLQILHRSRRVGGWVHRETLLAPGRAHFEYAQRAPIPGMELLTS